MELSNVINVAIESRLGVAIITGLLGYFGKSLYEKRVFSFIGARRSALKGKWIGSLRQEFNDETRTWKVQIEMQPKLLRLVGTGCVSFEPNDQSQDLYLSVAGGFLYSQLLKLDYRNIEQSTIQFGSMILFLDAEAKTLIGTYAGYGSKSGKPIKGDMDLRRLT